VERVGKVAHGLALRGTETFLPWMERLLHFLDSDDTGENTFLLLLLVAPSGPILMRISYSNPAPVHFLEIL
jgi:hypothetical protein